MVLVPIAVTLWVLKILIFWCEDIFEILAPEAWEIPGAGVFFTAALIFLTGVLTRLYLGRKFLAIGDWIIHKIPLGRGIYTAIKQLLNALLVTSGKNFHGVVLVPFPCEGSHMIGFVTKENVADQTLNVFVPTTPNPTSGFLLVISAKKVKPLDISAEQAFKLIVSGGTIHP